MAETEKPVAPDLASPDEINLLEKMLASDGDTATPGEVPGMPSVPITEGDLAGPDDEDWQEKKTKQELAPEKSEPAPAEEEQPEDPVADDAAARDLEKARTALERVVPKEVVALLSDEQVLKAGREAKDREAKSTREYQQLQEELRSLQSSKETDDGSEDPAPDAGEPSFVDPDKLIKPLLEELGEEAAKPIQLLAQQVRALQEQVKTSTESTQQAAFDTELARLGERFSGLEDPAMKAKVLEEFNEVSSQPRYRGKGAAVLPEVLNKAARAIGLEEIAVVARSKAVRQDNSQRASAAGAGRRGGQYSNFSTERLEVELLEVGLREGLDSGRYRDMAAALHARTEREGG